MNFNLAEVYHYDAHGVITKRRESIKALTYEHEDRHEIEWKSNFNLWPINIEMEIDPQVSKDKA